MTSYAKGKYVTMTGTFLVDDVLTDPTTVTLWVEDPDGTETDYTYADAELTKASTGVYYMSLKVTKSGYWKYKFVTTGTVADTTVDYYFYVLETVFTT